MSNVRLCVLLSLLIVNVASWEQRSGFVGIVDATITIISECLPADVEETVLLAGEYNDFLRRALFSIKAVALIADSKYSALENFALTKYSYIMYQNYRFVHFLRKIHRFVLVASSQPLLRSVLQRTKDSPWANANGFYVLIDRQTEKRGCINARSYLWAAWQYDLLSVVFLCIDPHDGIVCYTYNPYSSEAPESWQQVERLRGRHGHPWIIFRRKFVYDPEVCKDLDFDRTTVLDGYEVRLNAAQMEPFLKIDPSKPGLDKFSGESSELVKLLFRKLGVSLNVVVHDYRNTYELGGAGPNGTLVGMLAPVSDGRLDMGMNTRSLFLMWKLRYTYPHIRSSLCVMTGPERQVSSQFTKLMKFLSPPVLAAILAVCLLAYAILKRHHGDYSRAALDTIRLVLCVAILHPPKINCTRIVMCTIFIAFLNVNTWFQSNWSSLLTVPVSYSNIDSLESLKKTGCRIYGPTALQEFFNDPVLQSRYTVVPYNACREYIENSTNAVCAGDCYNVYHRVRRQNLSKSRALREITQTFVTRENWPLFRRVDRTIQRMVQTGLVRKFRVDGLRGLRHDWRKKLERKKGFRVMLLSQLAFSFYILGIGHVCAAVVFVAELVVAGGSGRRRVRRGIGKSSREGKKETE